MVRILETLESFKIVKQSLDALMELPEGDIITVQVLNQVGLAERALDLP